MPSLEKAEELRRRLTELGFKVAAEIEKTGQDLTNPEGPWRVHVLEADPHKVRVEIAHAYDAAIGLETTADLAIRHGALAAINGGYFRMKGLLAGDNQGRSCYLPAREDIAAIVGTATETASRIIAEFKRKGVLTDLGGNRFAVQGAVFYASAMRATQPNAAEQVRRIQDAGIPTIALTSRGTDYRLQTFRELRRQDISFWPTAIPPQRGWPEDFVPAGGERPARYEDGVFLVSLAPLRSVETLVPAVAAASSAEDPCPRLLDECQNLLAVDEQ